MKKILTTIMLFVAVITASAQSSTQPNRLIINNGYDKSGYNIDKVDSITFDRIDGEIKAAVTFQKFATGEADTIWAAVQRTPDCQSFSIHVFPTNIANQLSTDDVVANYFSRLNLSKYEQDFTSAQMTGFDSKFEGNTSYTIITLGYDKYGVAGEADRVEFTTPKTPTVGTPSVTYTIDSVGPTAFTLTVTPNADCAKFYWCEFNAGEAEQQFQQWGPMFGFANIEDMVKQFSGYAYSQTSSNTWDGLKPNSDYEVYVLPTDINGTYGDMVVIPVTTAKAGGTGIPTVDITVGNFSGDSINGYYQYVTYTPNDQAGVHHDLLISKETYDASYTDETILDVLKSDSNPFNPWDFSWDQVGVDAGAWNVNPSTAYYALSLAKNANDEWGPLAKKEFTTPAEAASAKAYAPVAPRLNKKSDAKKFGVVPVKKATGFTLTEAK